MRSYSRESEVVHTRYPVHKTRYCPCSMEELTRFGEPYIAAAAGFSAFPLSALLKRDWRRELETLHCEQLDSTS